eukprot:Nk52_evm54s2367 gene=Nk52_evmTU54s2367
MEIGKDTILFITNDDQEDLRNTPLAKTMDADEGDNSSNETSTGNNDKGLSDPFAGDDDDEEMSGAVGPDGEIDWDCPCLKGMVDGPCGMDFREAFSCFVHSESEPKGVDCIESFKTMQECMGRNSDYYGRRDEDEDEEEDEREEEEKSEEKAIASSPVKEEKETSSIKEADEEKDAKESFTREESRVLTTEE